MKRIVVMVTVAVMGLTWVLISVVRPASPAAAVVSGAASVRHHKTVRLCGPATKAGQAACFAIRQTDTIQPPGVTAKAISPGATPDGYGPSTLAAAYNLDQSKGSGQTVAVIDAYDDPNAESDLAAYRTQYGLPQCTTAGGCFKKVSQSGSTTNLPAPNSGWAAEIALDTDMVSATCPNCHILLVEANDSSTTNLGTAVNRAVTLGAKFVSNSYGGPENGKEPSYDSAYYHHAGVAITAAAGDGGYGAVYPATGAYVTAVGGTSLTSAGNARGWSETVWQDTNFGEGTGSGCSISVAKPSFQTSITTGCSKRAENDVSADADPNTGVAVYDTYDTDPTMPWQVLGGTSIGSPLIASLYALAGTPGASDSPNAYPYAHPSKLFDVTSGNNGTCTPAVLCTAGTGWDGPTGLGTPNGATAFAVPHIIAVTNPGARTSALGSPLSLQIQASDTGSGAQLTYAAYGLPPGLAINPATGLISGTPTTPGSYTVTVAATDATSASGATAFAWVIQALGKFTAITPVRVLDTRTGLGAPKAKLGAGATVTLSVPGLPAGTTAVALNVTVTNPSAPSFLSIYPGGQPRPNASNLNWVAGQTIPNMAEVGLGAGNTITIYNAAGTTDVIADVLGYYGTGTGAGFTGQAPVRALDTRTGLGAPKAKLGAGATVTLSVPGLPAGTTAVALNVTVTNPSAPSFLTIYAGGQPRPGTSNLNWVAAKTIPNMVLVPLGPGNRVTFYNAAGNVDVIADVLGYFQPGTGGAFLGVTASRALDTRIGLSAPMAKLGAGATLTLSVPGLPAGTTAVALNVTVTNPSAPSFLTVYPGSQPLPVASNLNYVAGQSIPNMVLVPLGPGNSLTFYNAAGSTDVIADIMGYYR